MYLLETAGTALPVSSASNEVEHGEPQRDDLPLNEQVVPQLHDTNDNELEQVEAQWQDVSDNRVDFDFPLDSAGEDERPSDLPSESEREEETRPGPHSTQNLARGTRDDRSSRVVNKASNVVVDEIYPLPHATVIRSIPPPFVTLYDKQLKDGKGNFYYPFAGPMEWQFASWAQRSGLSRKKLDGFMKLDYVKKRPFSFANGAALVDRLQSSLASKPRWQALKMTPEFGSPTGEVVLYHRNPLDAIKVLLSRPKLGIDMAFTPRRSWIDSNGFRERIYSEMFSGDWAWRTQSELPAGGALIPVMLGSDKTSLTAIAGGKSAWPLYLSIGNINSQIRNKPLNNAWILIAYIPCVTFKNMDNSERRDTRMKTAVSDRFFHQCLRAIIHPLIKAGNDGILMIDSIGAQRLCFPRVAAYLADYPEQCLVNAAMPSSSPTTTALQVDLGSSQPKPPRTRRWILDQIQATIRIVDPGDISAYMVVAKTKGLNGVHHPFWEDLPGYEPEICICPDLLHGAHRFWRDHCFSWISALVPIHEIDRRLSLLQPIINLRHFPNGISHIKQWTGREDRDLQQVMLALIDGHENVDTKAMECLRNLQEFLYLAQYRSHSDGTLAYMSKKLRAFHRLKAVLIDNGARNLAHFRIPKLAALHQYEIHAREMGTATQYSTEITETLHKTLTKDAYKATNRRAPHKQMCRFLDRVETVSYLDEFFSWAVLEMRRRERDVSLEGASALYREMATKQLEEQWEEELGTRIRRRFCVSAANESTRLYHSKVPQYSKVGIKQATDIYEVSVDSFIRVLEPVLQPLSVGSSSGITLNLWTGLSAKTQTIHDDEVFLDRTIQAVPPGVDTYGRYSCVLVKVGDAQKTSINGTEHLLSS
jgi:hypothetical protein